MKKTSETIIFFGNERLATGVSTNAPTLQALVQAGYNVAAVVSHHEATQSRNARDLEIAKVAQQHKIPVLLPRRPLDVKEKLKAYKPTIGVLVAYGKIVPQSIIDLFPCGIVNIHPSLLPLHRGPTPIESVILEGAEQTGVSIMRLVKAMDAGPVFGQKIIPLSGKEDKQTLANTLLGEGRNILLELLPEIINGSATITPQDESKATFDSLLGKNDGALDWRKPAERLEREVRAFLEWPKSRSHLGDKEVVITKTHVVMSEVGAPGEVTVQGKELLISTGYGALAIDRLKPVGKQEMTVEAFLAGYGKTLQKSKPS
jgi:methionyl-tRNA formyltransferase